MKIVLNGCFDLFHAGHRYLLETALDWSNHGQILVLINSDESVRRLKGSNRPVNNSTIRTKNILEAKISWSQKHRLYPSIEVVIFDTEEELRELIDTFQPNMIIKGNDRPDVRDIVGSDKWPVCVIPRIQDEDGDISTTRQLNERDNVI